jgi:hypothetical protein
MADLLGVIYLVTGGIVAGRVFVRLVAHTKPNEVPVLCVVTLLAWMAWPLAWGIMRATDQAAVKALKGDEDE